MNSFIILFSIIIFIIGVILIGIFTIRVCINLRKKERLFLSIKSIREILQLEIEEFKDFVIWLLNFNGYAVIGGKIINDYEIVVTANKDKKKQNIIVYKRAPNHLIIQEDVDSFKDKYLKNDVLGIIITTSDFADDVIKNNRLDHSISLISNIELKKMLEKRRAEDPF